MSLWVRLCKSHYVKFTTVVFTVNMLSWSYTKLIHFTFMRFLKLGLFYLCYFYTYSYNEQSLERNLCVLLLKVCDLWVLNRGYRLLLWCIMVDFWRIRFHFYTWISRLFDGLVDCMAWLGSFELLALYYIGKLWLNYLWYIAWSDVCRYHHRKPSRDTTRPLRVT